MNDKVLVFDDFLPIEKHVALYDYVSRYPMIHGSRSVIRGQYRDIGKHWNAVFHQSQQLMPAMNESQYKVMRDNHPTVAALWDQLKLTLDRHIGLFDALRIYMNVNPYGTNGYIHQDDGDYSAVYYPNVEWDSQWEGGTCLYKENDAGEYDAIRYVSYRPNRIVMFPATTWHRAMPVDKTCNVVRHIIAFKLQRNVNDPKYVEEFYNAKRS